MPQDDMRSSVLPEPMVLAAVDPPSDGEEAIQLHSWGDGGHQADFGDEPTETRSIGSSSESLNLA